MEVGKTLRVTDRKRWRAWLEKHHDSEPEIWLVYPNKASGEKRLPYNDAVEEALCFGWIDSILKPVDSVHRAQRFTPRRKGSRLSAMNLERVRRLHAAGKMTPAGLAVIDPGVLDEPFEVPPDIREALKADPETWRNFEAFPESYKRIRIGWIDLARVRPDVFETRLRYFLKMTKAGKRYGMVQ
jgi:uncharacterized protein YdeI (YjbR/CyaY-like superfamily)